MSNLLTKSVNSR